MLFSHDFESNEFNRAVDRFELDNKLKAGIERHRETGAGRPTEDTTQEQSNTTDNEKESN